jgi:hypothetical protein
MIQGRDGRFLLESRAVFGLQPLDGNDAIQPRIASLPDLAHAPEPAGAINTYGPNCI